MIPNYYLLIPFLPLIAFTINIIIGGRLFKEKGHILPIIAVSGSFFISLVVFRDVLSGKSINLDLYTWVKAGDFKVSVGFLIDELTAIMLIVVNTVSLLVHLYSIGYMHGDSRYSRFFSYLSLFTFSMLMLVMSNNFLQLYFGWEAVGLSSYFLIGFWFEKKSASDAAKKAFIVNRFGDFGFGLGVMLIFITLGTLHYTPVFQNVTSLVGKNINFLGIEIDLITLIALLLFCGAIGKSAQLPLHVWLPDAMEGPTPVSALIHAATMVTAGVFLVARANPIFNLSHTAMNIVAVIGALTAAFAATIALVQKDIKRVIAYSTVSQLGYMFVALGVGAYAAGIFHLYTHAFFKALLFLCAGSVMHALDGETDIFKMGGLKKYMPHTFKTMLIASLSISGVPMFAGFFSKDDILWRAYASATSLGWLIWLLCTITALVTAFYSFRIIFVAFYGEFRGSKEQEHHLHESPYNMTIPLWILAVGSIGAGYVNIPIIYEGFTDFMAPVLGHPHGHSSHFEELMIMLISIIAGGSGIYFAYYMYVQNYELAEKFSLKFKTLYTILYNKYYIDEIYNIVIVKPAIWGTNLVINKIADRGLIEGIVNGVPALIGWFSGNLRKIQTGNVFHYSLVMAVGIFILITFVFTLMWY
ncbi:proton-translocating NADH-quinone oxidoreductase, chain L [Candidatus Magnetoovum chiemensis]|nr:proton-translocating NADH-quinone oxidoreductase, chain L [Candidatus Magnetoovum chiemensis]